QRSLNVLVNQGQHVNVKKEKKVADVSYVSASLVPCANVKTESHPVFANRINCVAVKLERKDANVHLMLFAIVNHLAPANQGRLANARKVNKDANVIYAPANQVQCVDVKVENQSVSVIRKQFAAAKQEKKVVNAKLMQLANVRFYVLVSRTRFVNVNRAKKDANVCPLLKSMPMSAHANLGSLVLATLKRKSLNVLVNRGPPVSAKRVKKDANVSFVSVNLELSANVEMGKRHVYASLTSSVAVKLERKDANVYWTPSVTANRNVVASPERLVNVLRARKVANVIYALANRAKCVNVKVANQLVNVIRKQSAAARQERKDANVNLTVFVNVKSYVHVSQVQFVNVKEIKKDVNVQYVCVDQALYVHVGVVNHHAYAILPPRASVKQEKKDVNVLPT
ncbi:unnamed protein product, partial [Strongylus vulgaris]